MEVSRNRNLVIIPTRGRGPAISSGLLQTMHLSCGSDFLLSVDTDDMSDYRWTSSLNVKVIRSDNRSMNEALNVAAVGHASDYDFITFLGDDHVAVSENWDKVLMDNATHKFSVVFGNDLLSSPPLATFVLIDSQIVRSLGYMAPPTLRHMYLDDFWMLLGRSLGTLKYIPEVEVEHRHFSGGKSIKDPTYERTNTNLKNLRDRLHFALYRKGNFRKDLKKIRLEAQN